MQLFIIRYFCGRKLGVVGLINAYGMAAEGIIKNAMIKKMGAIRKNFIYL